MKSNPKQLKEAVYELSNDFNSTELLDLISNPLADSLHKTVFLLMDRIIHLENRISELEKLPKVKVIPPQEKSCSSCIIGNEIVCMGCVAYSNYFPDRKKINLLNENKGEEK